MRGALESSGRSTARALVAVLTLATLFYPLLEETRAQTSCFIQTPVGVGDDEARDVLIQPDGKIVVAGYSHNGADTDFAVIRYNPDLSLDTTFGFGTGIVVTDITGADDVAEAVAVQADGKIVAVGTTFNGSYNDFAIVRYNPDGSLDASFSAGGTFVLPSGFEDRANDVTIQADGKIVVAGNIEPVLGDSDFTLVRLNPDGSLDPSFDGDGIVTTPIGTLWDVGDAVTIQPDGKIVLGGYSRTGGAGGQWDLAIARYNSDGSLDTTFDADGKVVTAVGAGDDFIKALAIQPDGKLLAAGGTDAGANVDALLVRYNPDGSLDTTFDGDGVVTQDVNSGNDWTPALALQADGRYLVAGHSYNPVDADVLVMRYNPDGSLDLSFDADGIVTTPLLAGDDLGLALAVQVDGRVVVAGYTDNGTDFDHVLVRYEADGSLACGQLSLHPIADGTVNSFPNFVGCPSKWDCVNDQPANVGIGPVVTNDGLSSVLEDASGSTNREMFALPDGAIPGGARVTQIDIHGQVGRAGGSPPSLRLSYQRLGWDGSPVDGPAVITGVACCTDAITWTVTGLNWSAAELDALEIGVFHDSGGQLQVSQLYVTLTYADTVGPKKIYRSIGTAPDYTTGTLAATNGLNTVTGSGTSFLSANRGRGDRIQIDSVDYIISAVESETVLKLTEPFQGTTGIGKSYTISRQFATLQEWEDCISGGGACTFFPVASSSLVADDREEDGIAYDDSPFILSAPVIIDGSTTDKDHAITLTADPDNRHNGVPGSGVLVDGNNLPNEILVRDDYVTLEWLEIVRVRGGASQASIHVQGPWGPRGVRLRRLLIHDFYDVAGVMAGIALSGGGGKDVKIRNTMIWNGDAFGIQGALASDTVDVENVTIDDIRDTGAVGIDSVASDFTVQNTIVTRSGSLDFSGVFAPASSNNISQDGTAPGANALTASAATLFVAPGADLHLSATAIDAIDTGLDLSASFTRDIDDNLRTAPWDRGADERTAAVPFRIHYRSIGTNVATLSSGTASVSAGSSTVTFDAPLTGSIGQGDRLNLGGESFFILSVDTATQVTVQEAATSSHASESFSISRAYNTLQAWESARDGDLVTGNRREVGVVYDDGPFSVGVNIAGSTTDATRYMMLTVAPNARHFGLPGGGALIDSLDSDAGEINVEDHYTVIEGLEVRRVRGTTGAGVRVNARGVLLSNLLIHECKDGVRMSGNGGYGFTLRNSIVFANDDDGIEGDEITDTMTIENCTIYGNGDNGIDEDSGTPATVTNTLSLANVNADFAVPGGTQSYNLSSDLTASGPGSVPSVSATDNPSPGPGNWVVFESLGTGSENFHLQASAANLLAIDAGVDLSASFTADVDYLPRGAAWDIGADELGAFSSGASISSANNQSFLVGSSPTLALEITIQEDVAGGSVTASNDIRIRVPSGFHMRWNTSITNVTLSGSAAARVDSSVKAYEDGGMTVVLDVTSDFFGNENLIVNGLGFLSFTAPSPLDNLELETGNDGLVSALDDKTIAVVPGGSAVISSDADQDFTEGAPPALSVPITVTDASTPVFAVGTDIYIVIPAGLTMTWDTSVLNPTFGGPAASRVSPTVNYPNGSTLVITVTSPFATGDYLVISDLSFWNFMGPSTGKLDLQVGAVPTDTDDKTITILVTKPVDVFTATSTSTDNHLEWVNPNDPSYVHTRILARDDGVFPTDPLDLVNARLVVDDPGTAGDKAFVHDTGLTNDVTYHYTAFVFDGTDYSAGVKTTGRPFDHTAGDVQWAYSTGATAMAPPALRFETLTTTFVYMVSNDSVLHSVGGSGSPAPGEWPFNWKPYRLLGGPAQARPTVIPLPIGTANLGAVFLGSQDGTVYAVDADDGSLVWQSASVGDMLLASPAGIFTDYGAPFDFLVIGSRNSGGNNVFRGLNPFTGSIDWTFDNSSGVGGDNTSMGIVSSAASVLYQDPGDNSRHFFFASRTDVSPKTVWCVNWDGSNVGLVWSSDLTGVAGSPNVDGSPIHFNIHGGRVYVGTNAGEVVALDAATGSVQWVFDTGDGPIKGFLFPRFGTTHLLFSTTNKVWSLSDDGASASVNPNWPATSVANPSTPVIVPGASNVLVGSSDGHLYQLDINDPSTCLREKLGDGSGAIGTPTVDVFNSIVYVGSEPGIFYAVSYPLAP